MRKILWPTIACVLLTFSCTGRQTGSDLEDVTASVADTIDTAVVDTLEQLITETPMPRAADAIFDDFVFNY